MKEYTKIALKLHTSLESASVVVHHYYQSSEIASDNIHENASSDCVDVSLSLSACYHLTQKLLDIFNDYLSFLSCFNYWFVTVGSEAGDICAPLFLVINYSG